MKEQQTFLQAIFSGGLDWEQIERLVSFYEDDPKFSLVWLVCEDKEFAEIHSVQKTFPKALESGVEMLKQFESDRELPCNMEFYLQGVVPTEIKMEDHFNIQSWWEHLVEFELVDEHSFNNVAKADKLATFVPGTHKVNSKNAAIDDLNRRIRSVLRTWQKEYNVLINTGYSQDATPKICVQMEKRQPIGKAESDWVEINREILG